LSCLAVVEWWHRHKTFGETCQVAHQLHDVTGYLQEMSFLERFGKFFLVTSVLTEFAIEFYQMLDAELSVADEFADGFERGYESFVFGGELVADSGTNKRHLLIVVGPKVVDMFHIDILCFETEYAQSTVDGVGNLFVVGIEQQFTPGD
jgi:hypothetical protein